MRIIHYYSKLSTGVLRRDGVPGEDSDGESRYLALLLGGRAGEEAPEGEIAESGRRPSGAAS